MDRFLKKTFRFIMIVLCFILLPQSIILADGRIQKTKSPVVIVIDPGHGGSENTGTTENGFIEKDMTMTTALVMAEELRKFDNVEIYLTHEDDVDLSLKERAKIAAGYNADFLISLHYNASESHKLYGAEAWISLIPEYHAPGYQLGTMFLREFRDMGLTLRGIKTKRHSKGNDYYGILRESVNLGIPAIIVEHCHVDHPADNTFCDSKEELEAFGLADARAVAKYFGLKSSALGIDYSADAQTLPAVTPNDLVRRASQDATNPEYCRIELIRADYENDQVTVQVSASDPDSNLIYYSYSLNGGLSFCDNIPWPEGDVLTGEYAGTFEITVNIPDGTIPQIAFSATNPYDLQTTSNVLTFEQKFEKPVETDPAEEESFTDVTPTVVPVAEEKPSWNQLSTMDKITRILQICVVAVAALFLLFLVLFLLHGKKNKSHKKGNNSEK